MSNAAFLSYQQALDYLYQFGSSRHQAHGDQRDPMRNLVATQALLAALGNPHHQLTSILVAGTKGKGSTCALIESILRAAGYRTGLWTSPHLTSYRERIQVNREWISQSAVINGVTLLQEVLPTVDPSVASYSTTFLLGLTLALHHFLHQQVDFAIIEVGLGGRYDATNVVQPCISVITSISYDHMPILGTTLEAIAWDKAGIIKPGVPVITVPQTAEAASVIEQVATSLHASCWIAAEETVVESATGQHWPYPVPAVSALAGAFQYENTRLALATITQLQHQGTMISEQAMIQGLACVAWPGRFEVVNDSPRIILDGAHNGDSAEKLRLALYDYMHVERLLLILGVSHGKDLERILAALVPSATWVILTAANHPRAYNNLSELAARAQPYLKGELMLTATVAQALKQAQQIARPDDLICLTGSLFVVGQARVALGLAIAD
ncbi:MAG: bifunctional folylpolyglutamate synthase/dihydrofolate synthase [Chloroflexaceae bacterium]|nr:bifunctional folylpolyglutamate synthase/dihydrofolate synthase [Chloroflexaceae bacterium]